jgi:hypothetical protein
MDILSIIIFLIGVSGVIVIALNFYLEATNRLGKQHFTFAWLNLYGSSALLLYSFYTQVWLFVVLNGFLVVVGLWGLEVVYMKKKHRK